MTYTDQTIENMFAAPSDATASFGDGSDASVNDQVSQVDNKAANKKVIAVPTVCDRGHPSL